MNGAATELLNNVLATAEEDPNIIEVYLHVQTSNSEAKTFYMHHGFEDMGVVKDYYKNIDPTDSFMLSKKLKRAAINI
jgi:ribosomal protein S18 acetylase RimI-like enzyme